MILLTGSSGFLGQIILEQLGRTSIKTVNRSQSDYSLNLIDSIPDFKEAFELVIHCAGKAHVVPKTENQKKEFFDINVTGTLNLLKGLKRASIPSSFVFISSVAVYGREQGHLITEEAAFLASDAYGKSKSEAEKIIQEWCVLNNVKCSILRLPLIAGPRPLGNLKAMLNGIKRGYYFNIAGGKAKKSIVLAKDVANIIPTVASIGGIYNLTDGYHPSFSELSQLMAKQLGKSKPLNIPMGVARLMAKAGDLIGTQAPINSDKLIKITSDLTFDDSKARELLNWKPTPVLTGFKIK